jgi:MFS family permease
LGNGVAGKRGADISPGRPASGIGRPGRLLAGHLGPFADRNFRVFYAGYGTSLLGSAMSPIAINFALLDRGVTAGGLGVVLAAGVVPQVLFMIGAGVLADRLGRRPVMLAADVGRMAVMATMAALLFTAPLHVWVYAVLAALRGTGDALFTPALGGLRSEISAPDRLPDANALLEVVESAAMVVGPALAGTLIVAISSAAVVAVDAATYGVSVIALVLLRVPPAPRPVGTARRDLAEGWTEFRAHTWLWLTTAQWSLLNLLTYAPYLLLGPVLAKAYLGGARVWGIVIGAQAAGAVLTGLLLVGRRPSRPLLISRLGTVAVPLPCLLLALHAPAVAVGAAACAAGAGITVSGTFWFTAMQQRIPAAMLSRVTALTTTGSFAPGSFGLAVVGPLADAVGAAHVLAFAAAWGLVSGAAVCCLRPIWAVRWTNAPEPAASLRAGQQRAGKRRHHNGGQAGSADTVDPAEEGVTDAAPGTGES